MKTISRLVIASLLMITSYVSNAQGINFQGVSRSANGTILANSNISLRLSIMSKSVDATPEYVEIKKVVTNTQGIFSIVIGDALTSATGSFKNIDWAAVPKFLKVEMDPSGGTSFINMGITQLQYVPFSFYSLGVAAENVIGILPVEKGGTGVGSLADLKAALKLSNFDSTALSNRIDLKLTKTDTASLSNRINAVTGVVSQDAKYNLKVGKDITANSNTGYWNIAIGGSSLTRISTGDRNIGIGAYSLSSNSAGAYNIAIGSESMFYNTIGTGNNAIGLKAMQKNTTGNNNNAFGFYALAGNTSGGNNVAIGDYTLYNNTTAFNNVAVGSNAMYANSTGNSNVAIGKNALALNKTGSYNVAVGDYALYNDTASENTALGAGALVNNTGGIFNTAVGRRSLENNRTGRDNTAVGLLSQWGTSTGNENTSVASRSLENNTTGYRNNAFGVYSIFSNTTGNENAGFGTYSLRYNTTGNNNSGFGVGALSTNTVGSNNTAIGSNANVSLNDLSNATAIGSGAIVTSSNTVQLGNTSVTDVKTNGAVTAAGFKIPNGTSAQYLKADGTVSTSVTSGVPYSGATQAVDLGAYDLKVNGLTVGIGSRTNTSTTNTAIGNGALSLNTTGTNNTATGKSALQSNTTGYQNTANGMQALYRNTTGTNNTAVGFYALQNNTTGYQNTAYGLNALFNNTTGFQNTANGVGSLFNNSTGTNNTTIGFLALTSNTTGNYNTTIGNNAGNSIISGSNNTLIGANSDVTAGTLSNATAIGSGAIATASNTVQLGNNAVTEVRTSGIISSGKGFLPLGITLAERNAIASPTRGLIIYCSNCGADGELQMYNGTIWKSFVLGTASDGPSSTVQSGMVAYFPFNGNVNDASPSNLSATNTNATLTSDRNGNANSAYYFNGSSSKIVVNSFDKILGNTPFTVSFWIAPEVSTGWILGFGQSTNGKAFECGTHTLGSGNFTAEIWKYDYSIFPSATLTMNTYQFLTVTYDGSVMKVYKNGVLSNTKSIDYITTDILSGVLNIGKQIDFEEYFKGKLDDIRIYNRVLSQDEISYLSTN